MSRDTDEVEKLRKQLREAKSIIRSLQKQLKKLNKGTGKRRNNHKEKFEPEELEPIPNCPGCGKGVLVETEVVGRKFIRCELCQYREKIK